jgi:predicted RecB family nuclease
MVRLTASDFVTYFRPSKCENRIYLRHIGKKESEPSPYDQVLLNLGQKHETRHLSSFTDFVDIREGSLQEREDKTKKAIEHNSPAIYHPILTSIHKFGAKDYQIIGEPDFLVKQDDKYIIRDSKISRRITENDHPEILRQVEIYGWLYEQNFKKPPASLQVHSGTGEIVIVPYGGGGKALALLEHISNLKTAKTEIYTPAGWSKCGGCPFNYYCWLRAEKNRDVALVPDVDQNLVLALKNNGINSIGDLLQNYDEETLAEFKRPWGERMQKVGKKSVSIMRMARAISDGKEILIQSPQIPSYPNYVMFDLEGLPPQLDELEKIYLWGTQVFGNHPGDYMPATAGFGVEGDREGWMQFLINASAIFNEYGDIPFVHWHHYERVKIDLYLERYGDQNEIAQRVKSNLLDLLPITQYSVALPLPSYSLKVVEKHIKFKRTLEDVAGNWAMAMYIEAIETEDVGKRDELMNQILTYNKEDLEATWAVLEWLKSKISD